GLRVCEDLASKGMTMIRGTHEMNFARRIADTNIVMHEGHVGENGDAGLLNDPQTPELKEFLQNEPAYYSHTAEINHEKTQFSAIDALRSQPDGGYGDSRPCRCARQCHRKRENPHFH